MAVGIGIKLYGRCAAGRAGLRHVDNAGGAADAERRFRRRYFHVAGLGDQARDEGGSAERNIERGGVAAAALLVDEFVDDDARICGETEGRLVVECDAEGRIHRGLQRVFLEDRVGNFQRRARRCGASRSRCRERRDLAYRIIRGPRRMAPERAALEVVALDFERVPHGQVSSQVAAAPDSSAMNSRRFMMPQ